MIYKGRRFGHRTLRLLEGYGLVRGDLDLRGHSLNDHLSIIEQARMVIEALGL